MSVNILYLHGYCSNIELIKLQTQQLRTKLDEISYLYGYSVNHNFVNGFYQIEQVPKETYVRENISKPFYAHCFYNYIEDKIIYKGIDKSIEYLKKIVKEKNIQGIVAFSQGTYITSILSNIINLKFVVYFNGMPYANDNYCINTKIPSFHIIGENDEWFEHGKLFYKKYLEKSKLYIHMDHIISLKQII